MAQAAEGDEDLKVMMEESEIEELKEIVLSDRHEERLSNLAKLDACVTVIDAANFLETFEDNR